MATVAELAAARAMHLFREGHDTIGISLILCVTEAHASHLVYAGRCAQKDRPASFIREPYRPIRMGIECTRKARLERAA